VAVVTGAAGLLGPHHCAALASAGAAVVAADLDARRAEQVAGELAERGLPVVPHALDVADPASVRELADAVQHRFGRLDVLVNNAAVDEKVERGSGAPGGDLERYPLELWERTLRVNVTGTFLCCRVLGSAMARAGGGSIVNVSSTYGLVAPDQSLYREPDGAQSFFKSAAYPTSKAAVLGLTRYLAAWWGSAGPRVNALCPGGVKNGQSSGFVERYSRRTPLGRMAAPSDYEGAVVFLASDASSYMTGATLVVDGGFTAW
jgi:NAD(P)-dependent dehydrogenase (short-subunit alcohol dehydrogenase family)